MGIFDKMAGNAVMGAIVKKIGEVNVDKALASVLAESHGVADELAIDADGDGKTELENIKEDISKGFALVGDAFHRLEKAQEKAKAKAHK